MRSILVFFTFIYISVAIAQQETMPNNKVQNYLNSIPNQPGVGQSPFTCYVIDLSNNKIIAKHQESMRIPAASTMKLVTTAAALNILGANYTFKTQLAYSGSLDKATKTLNGDLYIIGGGDPTLGSRYYTEDGEESDFLMAWADSIKESGILHINGRVVADGSAYEYQGSPSGWVWGDMGNYYGAGPNGLTIYDNMLKLYFDTKAIGSDAKLTCTIPYLPNFYLGGSIQAAKSSRDNAYVFGAPYSLDWYITGSIPYKREDFMVKAANPDPELTFTHEFNQALQAQGITIKYFPETKRNLLKDSNYQMPALKTIYTHESPSLLSIINLTNLYSVNLFAEHLLCEIAYKRKGIGSTHQGALIAKAYLSSKFDCSGLIMTDGSGLSRSNAMSAKFLVLLLKYMKGSNNYKNSLAVAGKKGTMRSIGRKTAASGRVIGKSGSMSKMKAYAGYVNSTTGKKLAYAMVMNNYNTPTYKVKGYFEKLMVLMATY
ncbi:D-alanyl-D-alanine carboxypeptidase/D-alanyl-D-alanine-endopeptidase [Putridiphycobacter roseus]|uniref:D-alanyl-D-alanine carboxypeptidase/D-alanyl-D-alanine-endopeptidase n=1 Tax=Putridiphycobacter roseus TaxID=2219161 RepID=A0A2W1MZI5_9FLAO|nr:D-alanyl-D-alanine carboxypeptidase/D-alanyl-D-alanine-endopeptidase [Putridiphycobacter roseus]PZE17327.1 D-alanyl-D-alanine carboxypeptidase/D-alanyl-D-alanine-endopeptidase [Putridiphycobacter roseus]